MMRRNQLVSFEIKTNLERRPEQITSASGIEKIRVRKNTAALTPVLRKNIPISFKKLLSKNKLFIVKIIYRLQKDFFQTSCWKSVQLFRRLPFLRESSELCREALYLFLQNQFHTVPVQEILRES